MATPLFLEVPEGNRARWTCRAHAETQKHVQNDLNYHCCRNLHTHDHCGSCLPSDLCCDEAQLSVRHKVLSADVHARSCHDLKVESHGDFYLEEMLDPLPSPTRQMQRVRIKQQDSVGGTRTNCAIFEGCHSVAHFDCHDMGASNFGVGPPHLRSLITPNNTSNTKI